MELTSMSRHRMVALMGRALAGGAVQARDLEGRVQPRLVWDLAKDCSEPVWQAIYWRASPVEPGGPRKDRGKARDQVEEFLRALERAFPGSIIQAKVSVRTRKRASRYVRVAPGDQPGPLTLIMRLRCRECPQCRAARRKEWAARAHNETEWAIRTWFVTLTLRPAVAHQCLTRARLREERRGGVVIDGSPDEARLWCAEVGRLVTRYLYLLRKRFTRVSAGKKERIDGARFRYLCAFELHQGGGAHHGVPHVHLLMHERDARRPLRKRRMEMRCDEHPYGAWLHGFVQARLIGQDETKRKAVGYVTKYVAKTLGARVRSSNQYGRTRNHAKGVSGVSGRKLEASPSRSEGADDPHRPLVNAIGAEKR